MVSRRTGVEGNPGALFRKIVALGTLRRHQLGQVERKISGNESGEVKYLSSETPETSSEHQAKRNSDKLSADQLIHDRQTAQNIPALLICTQYSSCCCQPRHRYPEWRA